MKRPFSLLVSIVFALLLLLLFPQSTPAAGPVAEYLGSSHALLRIPSGQRMLLLPVEDDAPEVQINVLANFHLVERFDIRLARNHTDYLVPLELDRYDGNLLLEAKGEELSQIDWGGCSFSSVFDSSNREKFRPGYHFTPAYGWMNDPNGMVYKDGEYHLFFQYNPYGSRWGNMHWGHAVSRDLVRWEQLPIAIRPDALGTVYSGSCVAKADTIAAIFTSAGDHQMQSLAYSMDGGRTFSRSPLNPVIGSEKECRDPKVFFHEASGRWVLVLASPLEHQVLFYASADLEHWTFQSSFGKGWGRPDGIWECPDIVELPVEGSGRTRWVLIVNINPGGLYGNSATQYFVGDFDGCHFTCESSPETVKWMDYGPDHYAAVTWSGQAGGRHTALAWMSNWRYADRVPTRQFRSADTLPRDLHLFEDGGEHYLAVTPVAELSSLRGKAAVRKNLNAGKAGKSIALPSSCQGHCEILFDASSTRSPLHLTLSRGEERLEMTLDFPAGEFRMDRSHSGDVSFSDDFAACVFKAPLKSGSLRIFVDASSVEVFSADGRMAMTALVFPSLPYDRLEFRGETCNVRVQNLVIYPLM